MFFVNTVYRWTHYDPCFCRFAFNLTAGRIQCETPTASSTPIPSYGGANFVDLNLRVVVVNAPATMFAFKPNHLHGTTVTGGTANCNLTFAFSRHIAEAFEDLEKEERDEFGASDWGAGQGNLDDTHTDWKMVEGEDDT